MTKELVPHEDEDKEGFNLAAPQPNPPHLQSSGTAGDICSTSGTRIFAREFRLCSLPVFFFL